MRVAAETRRSYARRGERARTGAGTIRDLDAARVRRREVDVFIADAQRAHDAQLGQCRDFIGTQAGGAARQDGANPGSVVLDGLGAGLVGGGENRAKALGFDDGKIVLNAVDQDQ